MQNQTELVASVLEAINRSKTILEVARRTLTETSEVKRTVKSSRPTSRRARLASVSTGSPEFKKVAFLTKRQLLRRKRFSSREYTARMVDNAKTMGYKVTRKMAQGYRRSMMLRNELNTYGAPNPYNTGAEIYSFR